MDSMSVEDWIEANIFAGYEISFHHYGILRSLAIYLYYEKNIPYEKFYNSVVELCRNSDKDILNHAYRSQYAFYKDVSLENPIKLYSNNVYGDINWPPEHAVHMDTIYRLDEYYDAMMPLFESYGIDKDILGELIEYQKCILKRPCCNNFSRDFTYGWHEYFTKAIAGEYEPLKKYPNRIIINNESNPDNWTDYAREAVWFGKNGGTFNPGITNPML